MFELHVFELLINCWIFPKKKKTGSQKDWLTLESIYGIGISKRSPILLEFCCFQPRFSAKNLLKLVILGKKSIGRLYRLPSNSFVPLIQFLCPQLWRRSCGSILVSGCPSVHASIHSPKTVHARVLKFHIWIPHGKIDDALFFLIRVISLSGVMPLWKNSNKIWCMPYLMNHAC